MARELTNDENRNLNILRADACKARAIAHELEAAAMEIEAAEDSAWLVHAGKERKHAADERAAMQRYQSNASKYARAALIDAVRLNPPATNTGD